MALAGFFRGTTAAPYVEGEVAIPQLGIGATKVSFLLDTGADLTLLMTDDASNLSVDFEQLQSSAALASGIGGDTALYQVEARLIFTDQDNTYIYRTDLAMAEPSERNRGIPSLLGRDILSRWLLRYEAPRGVLAAEVDSADMVIPRER